MSDLKWHKVDVATLSPASQKLFSEYKAAYAAAKAIRNKFEALMQDEAIKAQLVDGKTTRLAINYNFGNLNMAVAPFEGDRKAATGTVAFGKLAA